MSKLQEIAAKVKVILEVKSIKVPYEISDFLDGEQVDRARLAQIINQMATEHDIKIGKNGK